jgi:hypothetical protein
MVSIVGLNRASSFAIKEESTAGTYVPPSAGTDFVPLRPGNELSYEPENLESDELLNDIGAAKSFTGKEVVKGKHATYLRHSGVEGQEPEVGVLYESAMGDKAIMATDYPTVSSSTTSLIKVNTGIGATFVVGQPLLIKNPSGYEMRNIASISGDDLTLNFQLTNAPASGVYLGKAITYIPAASGHPTFSTTKYIGGGHAKEVSAGNTVTDLSLKLEANAFGEVEFSYEGTKYYFNPITITSSNKYLDFTDDLGTYAVSVAEGVYKTPIALADALMVAMEAVNAQTYSVVYSSTTGKFTITSNSTLLSLLVFTGTNAANGIAATLGFTVAANKTGAGGTTGYTSENAQTYAAAYTPSYDSADAIVVKDAELFIGSLNDNVCICAQSVALKITKSVEDVDCICEETGVLEKIPTARTVELTVTAILKKYDVSLLDALLKNSDLSAMMNAGPKTGGNFIAGKCFNLYLPKCTVSNYKTTGDSFVQADITLKGFVTSTQKDIFLGFV